MNLLADRAILREIEDTLVKVIPKTPVSLCCFPGDKMSFITFIIVAAKKYHPNSHVNARRPITLVDAINFEFVESRSLSAIHFSHR